MEFGNVDIDIAMAAGDSAVHVDSVNTDTCHSSVVRSSRDDEIQTCLHRLLALG